MFRTVLVANRGEIAVRIVRTLRALGIRSVAVYSDADESARHVRVADAAIRIGPAPAAESYLDADRIVEAAVASGADAVHPGYGFLAENPSLARACEAAGIVFVGPPVAAIEAMADKIRAKATVAANGVRVVPGISGAGLDDAELAARATDLGFPLLVKPSAGGGGKGMRVVASSTELPEALAAARREARSAFGDDTLLLEQFVPRPRHVEVQILADVHGNIVHLGERECSLQRRHQKVIEEAPSPFLSDDQRDAIGAQAVAAARACGYTNAGTVEFIVAGDSGDDAYFLEMNTRLQVEHPVTEMVWGLDLVEQQLRIASGEPLGFSAADLRRHGHAIEARIYAEDPAHGFLPTGGTVRVLHEPDDLPGVRVDSSVLPGTVVGSTYDPMLSKIVAWGPDRDAARRRLDHALAQTCILGVTTNVAFQRTLLTDPDVVAGRLDTGLVERVAQTAPQTALPREVAIAAALVGRLPPTAVDDPWRDRGGWRLGPPAWSSWRATTSAGETVEVRLRAVDDAWEASVDGGSIARVGAQVDGDDLGLDVDGRVKGFCVGHDVSTTWVGAGGATWTFTEPEPAPPGSGMRRSGETVVTSPMPGTVVAVHAKVGERVAENEPVVVVEAMKMEHTLRAPCDAIVHEVRVGVSDLVALNQVLVVLEATDDDSRTK